MNSSTTSTIHHCTTSEYLVGQVIGEGAFGCVVHGRHKASGLDVAIKVVDKMSACRRRGGRGRGRLHPHHEATTATASILQEQRLLRQFQDCRYVVNLLASFHDNHCLYLVMECCTGGNLDQLIQSLHQHHQRQRQRQAQQSSSSSSSLLHKELCSRHNIDETTITLAIIRACAHYGRQILQGLVCLHKHGVIHADLTPKNILLSYCGIIQLADFGSAIVLSSADTKNYNMEVNDNGNHSTPSSCMVAAVTTTDYAAPEVIAMRSRMYQSLAAAATDSSSLPLCQQQQQQQQADDEACCYSSSCRHHNARTIATTAIDLWSLGCILYEFWCGTSPFHAASDVLAMERIHEYASAINSSKSTTIHNRHRQTAAVQDKWLFSTTNNNTITNNTNTNSSCRCDINDSLHGGVGTPGSSHIPEPWRDLIGGLLQVEPKLRHRLRGRQTAAATTTGEYDSPATTTSNKVSSAVVDQQEEDDNSDPSCYNELISHPAWMDVDLSSTDEPCGVVPSNDPPLWLSSSRQQDGSYWRDGNLGWSAFLV
jgi:serine/threonine protein kinase